MTEQRNYWETLDLSRVSQFVDADTQQIEADMIRKAYDGVDEPRPCDCRTAATRQYRLTIGAFQCPDCRTIEKHSGRVIR